MKGDFSHRFNDAAHRLGKAESASSRWLGAAVLKQEPTRPSQSIQIP